MSNVNTLIFYTRVMVADELKGIGLTGNKQTNTLLKQTSLSQHT